MTREIVEAGPREFGKNDWSTPRYFFEVLHEEYGFTVDLFAASYNACLPRYFGPGGEHEDSLEASWASERGFANPTYDNIELCLLKAIREVANGAFSVWLIPANTDTRWFHTYATLGQVDFIKGRLSFLDLTPPEIEIERLLGLYLVKGQQNTLKKIALCLNEIDPKRKLSHVLKEHPGGTPDGVSKIVEAAWWTYKNLSEKKWPVAERKPGPGFPSMVVTFDPEAPAGGGGRFRTRDAKTGRLL